MSRWQSQWPWKTTVACTMVISHGSTLSQPDQDCAPALTVDGTLLPQLSECLVQRSDLSTSAQASLVETTGGCWHSRRTFLEHVQSQLAETREL